MKIVHYSRVSLPVIEGQRCELIPVDHPDKQRVDNHFVATTSIVQAYDSLTGTIVTQNTVYVPTPGAQFKEHDVHKQTVPAR